MNPALILADFTIDENEDALEKHALYPFMKSGSATAYITLNSRLGVHVSKLAEHIGLHVPNDISILTFDNPYMEINEKGALSYISQSEEEIGAEAAMILLQLLVGKKVAASYSSRSKTLNPKLIIRDTTGFKK